VAIGCAVVSFFGVIVLGIAAAIAIPQFLHYQIQARQAEAKTNLSALFTAQIVYHGEYNTYAGGPECFDKLGWRPVGQTIYTYYCDGAQIGPTNPSVRSCIGAEDLSSTTPDDFVLMAVGNADHDPACDVWTIDSSKRLYNHKNDITDD
jgi:type IV pilus assembly protein PilA